MRVGGAASAWPGAGSGCAGTWSGCCALRSASSAGCRRGAPAGVRCRRPRGSARRRWPSGWTRTPRWRPSRCGGGGRGGGGGGRGGRGGGGEAGARGAGGGGGGRGGGGGGGGARGGRV